MTPSVNHYLLWDCCALAEHLGRRLGDSVGVSGTLGEQSSSHREMCQFREVTVAAMPHLQEQDKAEPSVTEGREGGKEIGFCAF